MSDDDQGWQPEQRETEGAAPRAVRAICGGHPRSSAAIRVIGLGNEMRGDDAVGLVIAKRLRDRGGDRAEVIELEGGGVALLDAMLGAQMVVIIDAMQSGRPPGTIHRFDARVDPIAPVFLPRSSHAVGVAEVIELAKALGLLQAKVILYGIEIASAEHGQPLSQPVKQILDDVIRLILRDIEQQQCTNSI